MTRTFCLPLARKGDPLVEIKRFIRDQEDLGWGLNLIEVGKDVALISFVVPGGKA